MIAFILLGAIALQVFLTAKKMSPFLSLLIVAILAGIAMGMSPAGIISAIEKGVGSTLGGLALIICLGAALGKILEVSGAAEQVSSTLIRSFGLKNIQWAMLLTGFLVGLPLYYNAGFVILVPLVFSVAKSTRLPLLSVAIPMAASLSTTHCFLPPHPGPVVLVNAFEANMGLTLLYGICIAIPAVLVAGIVFSKFIQGIKISIPAIFEGKNTTPEKKKLPAAALSFFIALLPILLITMAVLGTQLFEEGNHIREIILFIGDPTIALLISVLVAIYFLGIRRGEDMKTTMEWLSNAISGIAMIVFIITAGGVLKQVILDSGAGTYIAAFSSEWNMPALIFGWIATALLRVTIGSATVAGITAAGIVAPLAVSSGISPELMVLSVGAGSVFGSHINDSGFWMFKEFFGLSLKQTFLSWTIMETIISVMGLIGVLILQIMLF